MDSRHYPEEAALRAVLVKTIARERRAQGVRGDQLVDMYDAQAGQDGALQLQRAVASQICENFEGTPLDLYARVKKTVPSAKPCRMRGVRGTEVRHQLRIGDIDGWGLKRLLAVASSLGLEPVIELRPKRSSARS